MAKYVLSEKQKERKRQLSKDRYLLNKKSISEKNKVYYQINKESKSNYYYKNIDRIKEIKSKYYYDNIDKIKEIRKKYNKNSKPKKIFLTELEKKEKARLYRENNREKCCESTRKYRNKNRDKVNQRSRELKSKRRDELNELTRIKRLEDINFRLKCRGRALSYQACKKQNIKKTESYTNTIGCTIVQFKDHIESLFTNGMNWDNMGKWHLDHIKPCASFDLSDINQFKECFHYTNQRPLWASDNLSKSSFYEGVKHYHKKA